MHIVLWLFVVMLLLPARPADAVDTVSLRLDWVIGSEHAPIFVARDKGFFKEEGIEVNLLAGEGSTVVVKLVGNKSNDFGYATADQVLMAHAKGLPNRVVLMRHALRNAAVPIVTVIGIGIALLIGGVVVTESVYNIPGLGRLTVDAVLGRDYPTIQAVILLFSFVYVLINLLIDLAYTLLDPRIRY